MAERVVTGIAGKILGDLGSQVFQEIKSAFGVRKEIEKLEDTVSTIKDVLADAENGPVTDLVRRLKDALYDADDLLDDLATQHKHREVMTGNTISKEVRIFFSRSNQIAYSFEMSDKIKAVRKKLENIKKDNEFNSLKTSSGKRVDNTTKIEETHARLPKLVIGRDDDRNKIIDLLLESNDVENVSFIPIVGMGGLGKTTLANLVYNDEEVKRHFQLRMWVFVSKQFDVKMIVEKIIKSATNEEPKNLELDQLQNLLHESIDKKKYLLVLDDIWNEDPRRWTQLKDLLINGMKGSKILVTTRSQLAVKVINKHLSYDLEGLDKDDSWSLFSQIAFEHGIVPNDSKKLVKIGEEIVEKSGGVPLVISTIGSLLHTNIREDYWSSCRDNGLPKNINGESNILSILQHSYDHLPSHLKQCFAYCALFPKDFVIEKQKLISLWITQGFLVSSIDKGLSPKDIGNKYFMDLLMRSFFKDPKYDDHDNVITCKMHDLMHDLAKLVAGVECIMTTLKTKSIDKRCRHVSLDCGHVNASWKFPNVLLRQKQIRTLVFLVQSCYDYEWSDHSKVLSSYRYLHALDFSGFQIEKLSSAIGKLKYLRYLNLSNNLEIKMLPNSISKLVNLETLDLSYCNNLEKLPRDIRKMVNLKDLIITECESLIGMPHGLRALSNLQTLPFFLVSKKYGALEELCGLNNLRGELTIRDLKQAVNNAKLVNYLERMQFLQFLKLDWASESEIDGSDETLLESLKPHSNLKEFEIKYFMGVKLASWLSLITNLASITVWNCERCQYIPPLDELPYLKSLDLENMDGLEYISEKSNNSCSSLPSKTFFPSLKKLTLKGCFNLKGWWRRDDDNDDDGAINQKLPSFPCLSILEIRYCPNLTSMLLYPSVEEVTLVNTCSKPLQQTMRLLSSLGVGPSTSKQTSFSAPFSKLKSLYLESIDDLEYISEKASNSCYSTPSTTCFPSLKQLTLSHCSKLKGWWRTDDDGATAQMIELPSFACLYKLYISECPLSTMPLYPSLEELHLQRTSTRPLQQTMMMKNSVGPSTSNSFSAPLSKLKSLTMHGIDDLECLPEDGLRNLTSLLVMDIYSCENFTQMSKGVRCLTSLQKLRISRCLKFDWPNDDNDDNTQGFSSIRSLHLQGLPNLKSLPDRLQFGTSLQYRYIRDCPQLRQKT